jgi:hypothetical protein
MNVINMDSGRKIKYRGRRLIIGILTGFVALTAVGGGIALLSGAESSRFPLEWLRDTPFSNYTFPAIMLAFVVGGSSLLACLMIFMNLLKGILCAMVAGILLIGFVTVEIIILKQVPPGPTPIELLYIGIGIIISIIALNLGWNEGECY